MLKRFFAGAVGLALFAVAGAANATVITLDFPSSGSVISGSTCGGPLGAGGLGVCWTAGDRLDETFLGTGLGSAYNSRWEFSMDDWTAAGVLNTFDVAINGTVVGDFSFTGVGIVSTIVPFDLIFAHAPIAGPNYTLSIIATSTVPPGLASWNWLPGGTVTLHDIPEPGTLALFGFGLLGLGAMRRRRKTA